MIEDIFDTQLEAAIQKLEQLWEKTEQLPSKSKPAWRIFAEATSSQTEKLLLRESLDELSNTLHELQCALEEMHSKNEELAINQMLLESERQRYQELFDFTPHAYLVTDVDGVISEANQAAEKLLSVRFDRLIGKPLIVFLSDTERRNFRNYLILLESSKTTQEWELEIQPRNKQPLPAACIAVPILDSYGNVVGLRWQIQDISQRKQAEQIEKEWRMLDRILSASPAKICLIDETGKYLYASPAAAKIFGLAATEIVGKTGYDLGFPPQIVEKFDTQRQTVASTKVTITDEFSLYGINGIEDYEYTLSPLADDSIINGDAVVVTFRDITKHKQITTEINKALCKQRQLHQMKARLISIVSQEIRTPLANIFASAEILTNYSQEWSQERKTQQLQNLQASVKYIHQLFNDLILISEAEAGKLQISASILDVEQFCQKLISQTPFDEEKRTKINFYAKCEHTNACLDRKLLRYILANLLSNAIRYSPEGGEIQFDLMTKDKQIIFCIKDSGIGIPGEDRAHIFEWFYRGSNIGNVEGIGLGLSVVKQCVELHKGNITIESEVGVGTTVTVTLPMYYAR
ncbi:PAS domain S-box protein [Phormidium sp. LEGE 05292]|uniref:sensor histidine kinase n=1 Tax=[Phormidium] sp. LEGE 05292 TaxID=767427 RepID=UPI0018823544|nr:PAS domain-containing sensor histidine kinase [Phormidium sp. LEGE 05292]MBE9228179.1 PAS domain S-box protein [Phormidium sp. LEGE 05292]